LEHLGITYILEHLGITYTLVKNLCTEKKTVFGTADLWRRTCLSTFVN